MCFAINTRFNTRAALTVVAVLAASAFCEDRVVMSDSIKPLSPALTRGVRSAPNTAANMDFMISLKMRDFAGLLARIGAGELISADEMSQKYYPLAADYKATQDWLVSQGFTITSTDACRLCIFAKSTAAQVQQAMQTSFVTVEADGKTYISAATAPSLPASIAAPVLGVNGLQPHIRPHVHSHIKGPVAGGAGGRAAGNQPPFFPSQILQAYNATGLSVSGAGQTIGIVIDTPPLQSDLTAFWTATGVTQSLNNITFVQAVQGKNDPTEGEETLDTEWSSSMAPNAQVRVYVTTTLDFVNLDMAYQRIISDLPSQPGLKQVSCSYGADETALPASQMNTDAQLFASMASSGVSVFISTGDNGSTPDGVTQISAPSNDPSVTAVGGTSLFLSTTGSVASETVWNGTGGGTSSFFSRPAFQTGNGIPAGTFRLNPDVSTAADPNTGCLIIMNGQQMQIGGTSWSAPTWAGFCALINEARAKAGLGSAGMLGPKIYPLIGSVNFRDITSGSNGVFSATAGFDQCTGIGVPHVANLINALSGGTGGAGGVGPTITSFTPTSGPVGTTVVITGTNFTTPLTVDFNGVQTGSLSTSTQAIVQVPAGATTGPINVATSAGKGASAMPFTVTAGDVSNLPNLIPFIAPGWTDAIAVSSSSTSTTDSARLTSVDKLSVSLSFANIGQVAVNTAFSVELDVDGAPVATQPATVPFAAMGTQSIMGIPIGSLPLGTHTLTMKLDPANTVTESSETDNIATRTITILSPLPTVTIVATSPTADATSNSPGTYLVTLTPPQTSDITVNFMLSGSAVAGSDFMPIGSSVTIPAGQSTVTISIAALFNAQATADSMLILSLMPGPTYVSGNPQTATIMVHNIPQSMQVSSVSLKFNFRSSGRDSLSVAGTLPLGSGFMPDGQNVAVTVGGFTTSFQLNARGIDNSTRGQNLSLKGKIKAGVFSDSVLKYTLKLSNQDLFSSLSNNPGFSDTVGASGVTLPILFVFTSNAFVANPTVNYTVKGTTGTAK